MRRRGFLEPHAHPECGQMVGRAEPGAIELEPRAGSERRRAHHQRPRGVKLHLLEAVAAEPRGHIPCTRDVTLERRRQPGADHREVGIDGGLCARVYRRALDADPVEREWLPGDVDLDIADDDIERGALGARSRRCFGVAWRGPLGTA